MRPFKAAWRSASRRSPGRKRSPNVFYQSWDRVEREWRDFRDMEKMENYEILWRLVRLDPSAGPRARRKIPASPPETKNLQKPQ